MIHRFIQVNKNLFRGSAPDPQDVIELYKKFGIRKIVSLDEDTGKKINKVCKMLGIEHITIPLHATKISIKPLIHLLNQNLYDLLMKDGPTYVHCFEGKDRTGLVIAMFKCQYMGMTCQDAIKEAKAIGFGIGLPAQVKKLFEKLICQVCDKKKATKDTNNADIVDNTRQYGDFMGSVVDNATMQSFAPFMDGSKWQPYAPLYQTYYDQYPTRQDLDGSSGEQVDFEVGSGNIDMPQNGIRDNTSGIEGFGPLEESNLASGLGTGFAMGI